MRRGIPPVLVDWGLPLALFVLGLVEVFVTSPARDYPPPRWAHAVLLAAICGALLARRRHPTAVFALTTVLTIVWIRVLYDPVAQQGPLEGFLATLLAFYTVGAYADRRGVRLALPVIALGIANDLLALVQGRPTGNSLPAWIFYAAVFAFGRLLRSRLRLADQLAERAAQLEVEREENARRAVLEERTRIARELHDVISHAVSVMVVQASVERRAVPKAAGTTQETLATIERTGREALAELRRLLGVLRHGGEQLSLAPQPGLGDLDALVAQLRESGLAVDLDIDGDAQRLPPGIELSAYRIVQEALTNVLKHARARQVEVTVRHRPDRLELEIADDGAGGSPNTHPGGHGLIGMRERAALYGGSLEAGPAPDGGWRITARLPLEAPAALPLR